MDLATDSTAQIRWQPSLRSDAPKAVKFVEGQMRGTGGRFINVRMQAAVAAGQLEDADKAIEFMRRALADKEPDVRSAAAYAIAGRRDKQLAPLLEAAPAAEKDAETRHWLEVALNVTAEETDLEESKNFRTNVLGESRGLDRGNRRGQNGKD